MSPAVNVRSSPKHPNGGGTFDLPVVPHLIFTEVALLGKRHVKIVESASFKKFHGLVGICFAKGLEEIGQHFLEEFFLVSRKIRERNSAEPCGLPGELHSLASEFFANPSDECFLTLFAVECGEDFIGPFCLIPVRIPLVLRAFIEALRGVSIKDRTAKCDACIAVAITTTGAVTTREYELKFARARCAEETNGGTRETAVTLVVLIELTPYFRLVLITVQTIKNLSHKVLLIFVQDIADGLFCDVPVIVHFLTQTMLPREANRRFLCIV